MASHIIKLSNGKRRTSSLAFADKACHTCSKLNLPCDKLRPQCTVCLERGTCCPGYVQELKWGNGIASRGYNRFRDVPISSQKNENDPKGKRKKPLLIAKMRRGQKVTVQAVFKDPIQLLPLDAQRFIYHYHNVGSQSLFCAEGVESNLYKQMLQIALKVQASGNRNLEQNCLMNAIYSFSSWQISFPKDTYSHTPSVGTLESTDKALVGLQQQLLAQSSLTDELFEYLLGTIVMLIDVEQLQRACSDWKCHLLGTEALLQSYPRDLDQASSSSRGFLIWIIWCDINIALFHGSSPVISRVYLWSLLQTPYGIGWDVFQLTSVSSDILLLMYDLASAIGADDFLLVKFTILPQLEFLEKELLMIESSTSAPQQTLCFIIRLQMLLLIAYNYTNEILKNFSTLASSIIGRAGSLQGMACQKLMVMPVLEACSYLDKQHEQDWVRHYYKYWADQISCLVYIDCLKLAEDCWGNSKDAHPLLSQKQNLQGQFLIG